MRFSVVRFSLVRSLKKIQKNLAYADFHQSPSLVRKIWHMLIFIKVLHLCGSYTSYTNLIHNYSSLILPQITISINKPNHNTMSQKQECNFDPFVYHLCT